MENYSSASWTDDILLDLIRLEDNRAAFSELYLRYWKTLTNAAFKRLKSEEAAEEAVQDLFLNLYMRRREIMITSSLEAYLKTALKYQIFKTYRSQQAHYKRIDKIIADQQIESPTVEETLDNKMLRKRIYEVAGRMPDKCREVFLLSRYDQLSHKDIAEKLDISVSTVKKHLTKAMNIMRKEFNGHQMDLLAFCVFIAVART